MWHVGIDVGSTFTKYCVMKDRQIVSLDCGKTPVRQQEFFSKKFVELRRNFPQAQITSCGYGRENAGNRTINELTALARGAYFVIGKDLVILDIGGQDTKVISEKKGILKEFFINDKCAAGSGSFLINTLNLLDMQFDDIDVFSCDEEETLKLSSVCAVFAQSEIVRLIAANYNEKQIVTAVIRQILIKAKSLLDKLNHDELLLSGGMSRIKGLSEFASHILGCSVYTVEQGAYLSAIGCSL